jgi:hypothetical protein
VGSMPSFNHRLTSLCACFIADVLVVGYDEFFALGFGVSTLRVRVMSCVSFRR